MVNQIAGIPVRTQSACIFLRISSRLSFERGCAWPKIDSSRSKSDISGSVVALFSRISSSALFSWSTVRLAQARSTLSKEPFVIRSILIRRLEDRRRMLKTKKQMSHSHDGRYLRGTYEGRLIATSGIPSFEGSQWLLMYMNRSRHNCCGGLSWRPLAETCNVRCYMSWCRSYVAQVLI